MNRTEYFNYIEDKLGVLAYRINLKGKLNILDLHNHSENFYLYFINKLYGWNLVNQNVIKQNVEAIDLIDHTNKYIIQVSATNTKQKIETALNKESLKACQSYTFKFISISNDATELRKKTFKNPYKITFVPSTDIIDNKSILDKILSLEIGEQKNIYGFIKDELGGEVDIIKLDSNLAYIINILSKEDLNPDLNSQLNSFEIDRKIDLNQLVFTRKIIEDFAAYYSHLDKKYSEFDSQGSNKSLSVLNSIRTSYIEVSAKKYKDADAIFLQVIESVKNKVLTSANHIPIPIDELDLSVQILVVDAFIRCKIFNNPLNYNHVTT